MLEEKRVSQRFLFSEPVTYLKPEVSISGSVAGNISVSGISLKVQEFVPIGSILELQVCLGNSPKLICLKGEVVRMRETLSEDCYEIGLKFIKDEESLRAIGEYINTCQLTNKRS